MIDIVERFAFPEGDSRRLLLISESCPELIKILRLLSGSCNLKVVFEGCDDDLFPLAVNYVRSDQVIDDDNFACISRYLLDDDLDFQEMATLISRVRGLNSSFYKDLREELMLCLLCASKDRYTEAFLALYRLLERMSAACPLIYSSRQKDFREAHKFLSGIYKDGKNPGELGLLNAFLKDHARSHSNFRDATLGISIENWGGPFARELSSQWKSTIEIELPAASIDDASGVIACPFPIVASLITTVRNRSFHNLSGQKNLNLYRLNGPEPLFALLVPYFLSWTAYVFTDFARWQIGSVRL